MLFGCGTTGYLGGSPSPLLWFQPLEHTFGPTSTRPEDEPAGAAISPVARAGSKTPSSLVPRVASVRVKDMIGYWEGKVDESAPKPCRCDKAQCPINATSCRAHSHWRYALDNLRRLKEESGVMDWTSSCDPEEASRDGSTYNGSYMGLDETSGKSCSSISGDSLCTRDGAKPTEPPP